MTRGPLGEDQFLLSESGRLGALKQQRGEPPPPVPVPRTGTSEAWSVSLVTNKGLPSACTCWDRGQGRCRPRRMRQLRCPERPGCLALPWSCGMWPQNLYAIMGHTGLCPDTPYDSVPTLGGVPAGRQERVTSCQLWPGGGAAQSPLPPTWPTFCAGAAGMGAQSIRDRLLLWLLIHIPLRSPHTIGFILICCL